MEFDISRRALQRHLLNSNKHAKDSTRHFGRLNIFFKDMEEDLVTLIFDIWRKCYLDFPSIHCKNLHSKWQQRTMHLSSTC